MIKKFFQKILNLFKEEQNKMYQFSPERLEQLKIERMYLVELVRVTRLKLGHQKWHLLSRYPSNAIIDAIKKFDDQLIAIDIEIDFLENYMKQ